MFKLYSYMKTINEENACILYYAFGKNSQVRFACVLLAFCLRFACVLLAFCLRFACVLLAFCSLFARFLLAFCSLFAHKPYQNANPTHSVIWA